MYMYEHNCIASTNILKKEVQWYLVDSKNEVFVLVLLAFVFSTFCTAISCGAPDL